MLQVEQITSDVRYADEYDREPMLYISWWRVQIEGRELTVLATSQGTHGSHTSFYVYTGEVVISTVKISGLGFPFERDYASSAVRWHEPVTARTVSEFIADWLGLIPTFGWAHPLAPAADSPTLDETLTQRLKGRLGRILH